MSDVKLLPGSIIADEPTATGVRTREAEEHRLKPALSETRMLPWQKMWNRIMGLETPQHLMVYGGRRVGRTQWDRERAAMFGIDPDKVFRDEYLCRFPNERDDRFDSFAYAYACSRLNPQGPWNVTTTYSIKLKGEDRPMMKAEVFLKFGKKGIMGKPVEVCRVFERVSSVQSDYCPLVVVKGQRGGTGSTEAELATYPAEDVVCVTLTPIMPEQPKPATGGK